MNFVAGGPSLNSHWKKAQPDMGLSWASFFMAIRLVDYWAGITDPSFLSLGIMYAFKWQPMNGRMEQELL